MYSTPVVQYRHTTSKTPEMLLALRLNDGTIPVVLPAAECISPEFLRKALEISVQSKLDTSF